MIFLYYSIMLIYISIILVFFYNYVNDSSVMLITNNYDDYCSVMLCYFVNYLSIG